MFPWFQEVSRAEAELKVSKGIFYLLSSTFDIKLCSMKLFVNVSGRINGKFLVRNSVNGGSDSPYTLTVYHQKRIYNLNIRLLPQGKCVLGKKKINEVVSKLSY